MPTRFHESEEDTKLRRITPAIQSAGWKADQILMEYSLKADRYRIIAGQNCTFKMPQASRTKPDYILSGHQPASCRSRSQEGGKIRAGRHRSGHFLRKDA